MTVKKSIENLTVETTLETQVQMAHIKTLVSKLQTGQNDFNTELNGKLL